MGTDQQSRRVHCQQSMPSEEMEGIVHEEWQQMKFVFREVEFEDPTMCEPLNLKLLQGTVCSDDGFRPVGLSLWAEVNLKVPVGVQGAM